MIRIGVLGCGRWGVNHVRVFDEIDGSSVVACADPSAERLEAIRRRRPDISLSGSHEEIIRRDDVDAVVVATPTSMHAAMVRLCLEAGKDVLCEKPLALTADECRELDALARSRGRILMVGHVFLFNNGILKLKEILGSGALGRLYYLHATRTNLGPIREDVGAIADLATHDISIFNFLLGCAPESAAASTASYLRESAEDVAFLTLSYPAGVIAGVHVSWLDPVKVRRITAVGEERMAIWDDLGVPGPIALYNKRVVKEPYESFGEFQVLVREGDLVVPHVRMTEPLRAQAGEFLRCVRERAEPESGARLGAGVAAVLEAVARSCAKGGAAERVATVQ